MSSLDVGRRCGSEAHLNDSLSTHVDTQFNFNDLNSISAVLEKDGLLFSQVLMRLLTYQGDQVIMTLSVSGSLVSVGTFIHVEILKVNRKQYQRSRLMAVV